MQGRGLQPRIEGFAMACGRRFLRAAESRAPGAVVMAVGICPRYAISSHPARAVLPFLSGSCQKTSICCQRLAKGLPFPAKNCNSLPGFRTYQRLTGEWQGKIGDEAVRRYLADPTTPILGSDFLSVQALALQSSPRDDWPGQIPWTGQAALSVAAARTNVEHNAKLGKKMLIGLGARTRYVRCRGWLSRGRGLRQRC